MEKNPKKTIALLMLGLPLVAILAATIWISVKIATKPGPKQEREAIEKALQEGKGEDIIKLEKREQRNAEILTMLAAMPKFEPPADELIPPDRMAAYADIHYAMVTALVTAKATIPKENNVSRALFLAQKLLLITKGAQFDKMVEHGMSGDEFQWIQQKVKEGMLVAFLNLEKRIEDPEELARLRKSRDYVAITAGFQEPTPDGEVRAVLDDFDPTTVSIEHYHYALKYVKELSYPEVPMDFHDWSELRKEEGLPAE